MNGGSASNVASDDEELIGPIFQEPEGYFQPEKPATFADYTLRSGQLLRLRLVGQNPLWGHLLWNASQVLADYLQQHPRDLVRGRNVLELGAGAGLPSLVSSILGAHNVVMTDYPDADLLENLKCNITATRPLLAQPVPAIIIEGYVWGSPTSHLLCHISSSDSAPTGFDTIFLADLIFNHSEHNKLLRTVQSTLRRSSSSRALVFFTPHRPWLLEKDLSFFDLAREGGFVVDQVLERVTEKPMFLMDRGDELLRRTVYGYELRWKQVEG